MVPRLDNVLVKRQKPQEKIGSLFVPSQAQRDSRIAEVVAFGPGLRLTDGTYANMGLCEGQEVLLAEWAGVKYSRDGEEYLIVKESDILLILD